MPSKQRSKELVARGGGILFGIFWTLFSSIFVVAGVWIAFTDYKKSQWEEVPCDVVSLEVKVKKKENPSFLPVTEYNYTWEGVDYKGTKVFQSKEGVDDYQEVGELEHRFRFDQLEHCYVNPTAPEEAALVKSGSLGFLGGVAFATFGMIFVLIGIGIMIGGKRKQSLADEASDDPGMLMTIGIFIVAFIFCGAFGIGGLAILINGIGEMREHRKSDGWIETPATVIWNRVATNSDSDGDTYHPEVFYRYKFKGVPYRRNYNVGTGVSTSGYASNKAIAKNYPKGMQLTCYVNPDKPWQSVIDVKHRVSWFTILFSFPFLLVGVVGVSVLVFLIVKGVGINELGSKRGGMLVKTQKAQDLDTPEQMLLQPKWDRLLGLGGMAFFMLFWNGIVSVFVVLAVTSHVSGEPEWFLTFFIIPFVLAGIGLILSCLYKVLALFAPSPKVMLSPGYFVLGEVTYVAWKVSSGGQKISDFTVKLVGLEEAMYERGTDTETATSCFYEQVLVEESTLRFMDKGTVEVIIPTEGVLPSWESENNAIKWKIKITGSIDYFPDIKDEYEVSVLSPEMKSELCVS